MQAIILAGGYGTRLYPLTLNAPKPMIQVGERPMIEYLVEKIQKLPQIHEIFIVSNDKFTHVFDEWLAASDYENIKIINDGTKTNEDRLWSIGDIQYVIQQENIYEDVIILGGDNLIEDDFRGLMETFLEKWNTIGLYDVGDFEYAKQLSTPVLDNENRIIQLLEKPENPTTTLIGTLIYVLKNESLKYIDEVISSGKADRAGDFIAYLCQKENVYGFPLKGEWFDIGTLEQLKKAEDWICLIWETK